MDPLALIEQWPVDHAAAAIIEPGHPPALHGATDQQYRLASLTKPIAAWALMIAVEEGSLELHQPAAPNGATLEHLLAHAGGYPFDGQQAVGNIERKRIYSNTGFEYAASALEQATAMPFAEYLRLAVFEPLGMSNSVCRGSAAHGVWAPISDVARFVSELLEPTLVAPQTYDTVVAVHYPELSGTVPGVGSFDPCPWGLGVEIRGEKSPHWMGATNSPATFGHFGGAGTMLWADPVAKVGTVALTDRPFEQWADHALRRWPEFSDAVIASVHGQ